MNKVIFLFFCLEFVFGFHSPGSPLEDDGKPVIICKDVTELDDGILQVGFSAESFYPITGFLQEDFPWTDADTWAAGFDAAIIRTLANMILLPGRRTPIVPKFIYTDITDFETDMLSNLGYPAVFDASIGFISSTFERESKFNVKALNYSGDVATTVILPDTEDPDDYLTYENLCGKRLSVMAGTIFEGFVADELNKKCDAANLPHVIIVAVDSVPASRQLLIDGDVDGLMEDTLSADQFMMENDGYFDLLLGCFLNDDPVAAGPPFSETLHLGIYVHADALDLQECLQRGIDKMAAQGKILDIFILWAGRFLNSIESELACVKKLESLEIPPQRDADLRLSSLL